MENKRRGTGNTTTTTTVLHYCQARAFFHDQYNVTFSQNHARVELILHSCIRGCGINYYY